MTYGSQLVIARLIGPDGYGTYAYVFSWMTILAYAAALGFDVSTLRFVPTYQAQAAWPLVRGVIQYAERRTMLAGAAVVVIAVALMSVGAGSGSPALRQTFLAGLGLVPIWALLWVRCSLVRACGGVIAGLVPDRLVRDGILIALLGAASFALGWHIDAPTVMLATLLSSAIGLALATHAARRRRPPALRGVAAEYAARVWRRTAFPLVAIGIGEVALNRTGVVLLGWSGDTRAAGLYALAFNFALVVALPRTAVNAWLAPTISALHARGDRAALQRVVARASGWTLAGAIGLALTLGLLAGPLLAWFGHDFGAGLTTLQILLVGQVIAAAAGSQMFLLTMTGHEDAAALMLAVAVGFNALLSAAGVALLGPVGAALAATFSLLAWNAAMAWFIHRRVGLAPGVLAAIRLPPLASTRRSLALTGQATQRSAGEGSAAHDRILQTTVHPPRCLTEQLPRDQGDFSPVMRIDLLEDVVHVHLGRAQRDIELVGDDLVRRPAAQQFEHRPLARRQFVNRDRGVGQDGRFDRLGRRHRFLGFRGTREVRAARDDQASRRCGHRDARGRGDVALKAEAADQRLGALVIRVIDDGGDRQFGAPASNPADLLLQPVGVRRGRADADDHGSRLVEHSVTGRRPQLADDRGPELLAEAPQPERKAPLEKGALRDPDQKPGLTARRFGGARPTELRRPRACES